MTAREYPPGMQAPVGGTFEQRSVLGSPTGVRVTVARGEPLPNAPRGQIPSHHVTPPADCEWQLSIGRPA